MTTAKQKLECHNILLVEDSETDAYVIKRILEKNLSPSCEVRHAENMAEAESILTEEKSRIDLILLDLGLPDTSGRIETYRRLENAKHKSQLDDIPVVILTSVSDRQLALGIVDSGAENYVKKAAVSQNPEILRDAVEFAICRHKHMMNIRREQDRELQKKQEVIEWMTGGYSFTSRNSK